MNLIEATIDKSIIKAGTEGGSLDIVELADKIGIDADEVCESISIRWIGAGRLAVTDGNLMDAKVLTFAPLRLSATAIRQLTLESKAYGGVITDDLGGDTQEGTLMHIGKERVSVKYTHDLEGSGFWSVAIREQLLIGGVQFEPVLLCQESMIPSREDAEEFVMGWMSARWEYQSIGGLYASCQLGHDGEYNVLRIEREGAPESATPVFEEVYPDKLAVWEAWSEYKLGQFVGSIYKQVPDEPDAEDMAGDAAEDITLNSDASDEVSA